jgi:hypothetical protein
MPFRLDVVETGEQWVVTRKRPITGAATASGKAVGQNKPPGTWVKVRCIPAELGKWGGWGSNPRPADYESAALTG